MTGFLFLPESWKSFVAISETFVSEAAILFLRSRFAYFFFYNNLFFSCKLF